MKKFFTIALLSVSVILSGTAIAGGFANNTKVSVRAQHFDENWTLLKQGSDANGDGIYVIQTQNGKAYLTVASGNEGEEVRFGPTKTQWVLHEHSTGWSIMPKANGAYAVTRMDRRNLVLQFNQGRPNQVWRITAHR